MPQKDKGTFMHWKVTLSTADAGVKPGRVLRKCGKPLVVGEFGTRGTSIGQAALQGSLRDPREEKKERANTTEEKRRGTDVSSDAQWCLPGNS